jgi:hypothetical protein
MFQNGYVWLCQSLRDWGTPRLFNVAFTTIIHISAYLCNFEKSMAISANDANSMAIFGVFPIKYY